MEEPDLKNPPDTLNFVNVPPPSLRLYPKSSHIAEKLHAFTMPRDKPNSRVKDSPDLALLAMAGSINSMVIRAALEKTFSFRKTHPLPKTVPSPPENWEKRYAKIADREELRWKTLDEVTMAVKAFLDPVLAGEKVGEWNSELWSWSVSMSEE